MSTAGIPACGHTLPAAATRAAAVVHQASRGPSAPFQTTDRLVTNGRIAWQPLAMTTERPSAPGGASGRASGPSGRHSLHLLVQQIGEIVAQGEDSGSQQSQSDGGLRVRLRTVLLALLDGIMGDSAGEWAG